jgi:hypothetical protein
MAIINCYECSTKISTNATSCPKCGALIKSKGLKGVDETVTTELTSKRLKLQVILSKVLLVPAFAIFMVGVNQGSSLISYLGGLVGMAALLWLGVTNLRIYWNHE